MDAATPDPLLERFTAGDPAATEEVFRLYQPYLRAVVGRYLSPGVRPKFDADDIVQSVWVHVLVGCRVGGWRFADPARFRAFLARLARRRYADYRRQHRLALEREKSLTGGETNGQLPDPGPQPPDVLQSEELWARLLALCPPAHHHILRLKREGLRPAEIAARTGLHEGSVRRILNDLAQRLAYGEG